MSIEKFYGSAGRIFTPTCDMCGATLAGADSFDEAVQEKKDAGWRSRRIDGEWQDACTECQEEEKSYGKAR